MRPWFFVALVHAVLVLGCSTLSAEPARVQPPRSIPLQVDFANTYHNQHVRVIETVWLDPYPLQATGSLAEIRTELNQVGPLSKVAGKRFDALTTWSLRWTFNFDQRTDACSLRNATIEVEAVVKLPQAGNPSTLPLEESDLWIAYLQDLRLHEDGHINIYRAGAQELSDEILALGAMPACDQLRAALKSLGEARIARIAQADLEYDRQTGHGTVFPLKE